MRNSFSRTAAAGLSLVYFLTNVAFASAPETNIWADRRLQATTPTAVWAPLLQKLSSSLSDRARPGGDLTALSPTLENVTALVQPFGDVREVHVAAKDAPIVIHVQDVHDLREAQVNMAAMMLALQKRGVDPVVGVEGAFQDFNLAPYRAYPRPDRSRQIADVFLDEGIVGGPEYAALTAPSLLRLEKIEDRASYLENIESFRRSVPEQARVEAALDAARLGLAALKKKFFTPELADFDLRRSRYEAGSDSIGPYLSFLTSKRAADPERYPSLHRLAVALAAEAKMDFASIERERAKLAERLAQHVSAADLQGIAEAAARVRSRQMTQARFYEFIAEMSRRNGISLGDYPRLTAYMDYARLAEDINPEGALRELPRLEADIELSLAVTPDQRTICGLNGELALVGELIRHEMTPDRWAEYDGRRESLRAQFAGLERVFPGEDVRALSASLRDLVGHIEPYEAFCRCAVERNDHFAENIAAAMNRSHARVSFLVAGGFHSTGLAKALRAKNLSYLIVTPRITRVDGGTHYLDVLARDPLPVERLFAGEKIDLVSPRVFANPDSLRGRMATGQFVGLHAALAVGDLAFAPGTTADRAALQSALAAERNAAPSLPGVSEVSADVASFRPGSSVGLTLSLTQSGRRERFDVTLTPAGRPAPAPSGQTVFEKDITIQGQAVTVRFHEPAAPGLVADILAPLRSLQRFREGPARLGYYAAVAVVEEGLFRLGGVALAGTLMLKTGALAAGSLGALSGGGLLAWIAVYVAVSLVLFVAAHIALVAITSPGQRSEAVRTYVRQLFSTWRSPLVVGAAASVIVGAGVALNLLWPALVLVIVLHDAFDMVTAVPAEKPYVEPAVAATGEDEVVPADGTLTLGAAGRLPGGNLGRAVVDVAPPALRPGERTDRFLSQLKTGSEITIDRQRGEVVSAYVDNDVQWIAYVRKKGEEIRFASVGGRWSIKRNEDEIKGDEYPGLNSGDESNWAAPFDVRNAQTATAEQVRDFLSFVPQTKNPWLLAAAMELFVKSPTDQVVPALVESISRAGSFGRTESYALTALSQLALAGKVKWPELRDRLEKPLAELLVRLRPDHPTPQITQLMDALVAMDPEAKAIESLLSRSDVSSVLFTEVLARLRDTARYQDHSQELLARLNSDPDLGDAMARRRLDVGAMHTFSTLVESALGEGRLGPAGSLARRSAAKILGSMPAGQGEPLLHLLADEPDTGFRRDIAKAANRPLDRRTAADVLTILYGKSHAAELAELGRFMNLDRMAAFGLWDSPLLTVDGLESIVSHFRGLRGTFSLEEIRRLTAGWHHLNDIKRVARVGRVRNKPGVVDDLEFDYAVDGKRPPRRRELDLGIAFVASEGRSEGVVGSELSRRAESRQVLIDANFEAIANLDPGLNAARAGRLIRSVRKMVDAYRVFAPSKAAEFEAKFAEILQAVEPELAQLGPDDLLPKDLESRLIRLEVGSDGSPVALKETRTLHSLFRWMHDRSTADFIADMPQINAEPVEIFYSDVPVKIVSTDGRPIFADGQIVNPAVLAFLKGLRLPFLKQGGVTIFVHGNTVDGFVQLGFHRAEFSITVADPDQGGAVWLRFLESDQTVGADRLPYLNQALIGIGMHTKVGNHTLTATADKNFGVTTQQELEDVAQLMVGLLYQTKDLDASFANLADLLARDRVKRPEKMEDIVASLADIFVREGRVPIDMSLESPERAKNDYEVLMNMNKSYELMEKMQYNPFANQSAEPAYDRYKAYLQMSAERSRRLGRAMNFRLRELGLPEIPVGTAIGQRTVDRYYNAPIARAIERGDVFLDADGVPRRAPNNPTLPELASAASAGSEEAFATADVLDALNLPVTGMALLGRVGALTAYQGVVPLASGESLLLNVLVDPESGAILFGRGYLQGIDRQKRPLSLPELRARLSVSPGNERSSTPAQRARAMRLLRVAAQPDLPGSQPVGGLVVSTGKGRLVFGRVVVKGDADSESETPGKRQVLLAQNTEPNDLAAIKNSVAVIATSGGKLSHVGVTTREFEIPSMINPDAAWTADGVRVGAPRFGKVVEGPGGISLTQANEVAQVTVLRGDFVVMDPTSGRLIVLPAERQAQVERILTTLSDIETSGDLSRLDSFFVDQRRLVSDLARARPRNRADRLESAAVALQWITTYLVKAADTNGAFYRAVAERVEALRPSFPPDLAARFSDATARMASQELVSLADTLEDADARLSASDAPSQVNAVTADIEGKRAHAANVAPLLSLDGTALRTLSARADAIRADADRRLGDLDAALERDIDGGQSLPLDALKRLVDRAERDGRKDDVRVRALVGRRDDLLAARRGEILAEKATVYDLKDIGADHAIVVGPKAATVAELSRIAAEVGASVPDGLALTTNAFDLFLKSTGIEADFLRAAREIDAERSKAAPSLARLTELAGDIRRIILSARITADSDLGRQILTAIGRKGLETAPLAVRSSAVKEDTEGAAYAGAADSFLFVTVRGNEAGQNNLLDVVVRTWASFWQPRGVIYRGKQAKKDGLKEESVRPAVLIQQMIDNEIGGVTFTADPNSGRPEIVTDAAPGLTEGVVKGDGTIAQFASDRVTFQEVRKPVTGRTRAVPQKVVRSPDGSGTELVPLTAAERERKHPLDEAQVSDIARKATALRARFGKDLDIEWGIKGATWYLFQARPMTTGKGTADLLEPFVYRTALGRLLARSAAARGAYYLFVGVWESLFLKAGFIVSGPLFFFLHPVFRWLANSSGAGVTAAQLKQEISSEFRAAFTNFFGSRLFAVLAINAVFYGVTAVTGSHGWAFAAAALFHFALDLRRSPFRSYEADNAVRALGLPPLARLSDARNPRAIGEMSFSRADVEGVWNDAASSLPTQSLEVLAAGKNAIIPVGPVSPALLGHIEDLAQRSPGQLVYLVVSGQDAAGYERLRDRLKNVRIVRPTATEQAIVGSDGLIDVRAFRSALLGNSELSRQLSDASARKNNIVLLPPGFEIPVEEQSGVLISDLGLDWVRLETWLLGVAIRPIQIETVIRAALITQQNA